MRQAIDVLSAALLLTALAAATALEVRRERPAGPGGHVVSSRFVRVALIVSVGLAFLTTILRFLQL